jgi:hypothetical protein
MYISKSALLALVLACAPSMTTAFAPLHSLKSSSSMLQSTESTMDPELSAMIAKEVSD